MPDPHFIIIGAPKCGTSSLYAYLSQHPKVHVSPLKERNFFMPQLHDWTGQHPIRTAFRRTILQGASGTFLKNIVLARYHRVIDRRPGFVSGDGSCNYFSTPGTEAFVHAYYPDAKLILMLRNPIDRLHSNFWMNLKTGAINFDSFESFLDSGGINAPEGLYVKNLDRWLRYFRPEDLFLIDSEAFFQDEQKIYDHVCRFIGIEPIAINDSTPVTPASEKPHDYEEMSSVTRQRLAEHFREEQDGINLRMGTALNWLDHSTK